MAFANWDIVGTTDPVLNSTIPTPLPQPFAGPYCRRINRDARLSIKSTFDSGNLFNIPITRAIRAQCCMRRAAVSGSNTSAGVVVKSAGIEPQAGYGFVFNGQQDRIMAWLNDGQLAFFDGAAFGVDWASVRMEVFPVGTAGDRIFYYRETTIGSDVWTELTVGGRAPGEGFWVPFDSPRYAPWGNNRVCAIANDFGLAADMPIFVDKVLFQVTPAP